MVTYTAALYGPGEVGPELHVGVLPQLDGSPVARIRVRYPMESGQIRECLYALSPTTESAGDIIEYRWIDDQPYEEGAPPDDDWLIERTAAGH